MLATKVIKIVPTYVGIIPTHVGFMVEAMFEDEHSPIVRTYEVGSAEEAAELVMRRPWEQSIRSGEARADGKKKGRSADKLTFAELREANMKRLPQFKNAKGEPMHSKPDGSDWALSAWCNAVTGELGEAANLIKKLECGYFDEADQEDVRQHLAHELADVTTYLDILACQLGVDLGRAVREKFNIVSRRVGSDVFLGEGDPHL
jgi:NTP pyrophosphatase (non-canonical NTP hydrolase)